MQIYPFSAFYTIHCIKKEGKDLRIYLYPRIKLQNIKINSFASLLWCFGSIFLAHMEFGQIFWLQLQERMPNCNTKSECFTSIHFSAVVAVHTFFNKSISIPKICNFKACLRFGSQEDTDAALCHAHPVSLNASKERITLLWASSK